MAANQQIGDTAGAPAPMTIVDLLSPLSIDRFLADHWTKAPLHLPGKAGRFSPILTWADLARHLETVVPDPQRIRVVRSGKRLVMITFMESQVPDQTKRERERAIVDTVSTIILMVHDQSRLGSQFGEFEIRCL